MTKTKKPVTGTYVALNGRTYDNTACGHVEQEGMHSLSRYGHGQICSSCGTREALEGKDFLSPVDGRKGLIVDVLKPADGDSSNGGFSSSFKRLTLVGPGIPEIFDVSDECPAVVLKLRWGIGGKLPKLPDGTTGAAANPYVHAEPGYPVPSGERGYMFGGCAIYSSDSRFPFDYPIKLHDRSESQ